jgi:hypothetical protein
MRIARGTFADTGPGKHSGPYRLLSVVGPYEPAGEGRASHFWKWRRSVVVTASASAARFEYVKRGGQEGDGGGPAEIPEEAFELVWPVCDLHDREHRAVG